MMSSISPDSMPVLNRVFIFEVPIGVALRGLAAVFGILIFAPAKGSVEPATVICDRIAA